MHGSLLLSLGRLELIGTRNPYNWSKARKMSITMLWILMSSSTSIQSSVFSGTNEAVSIEFGIGEEVAVLGTSLYILVCLMQLTVVL